jgi:hypothetical protein
LTVRVSRTGRAHRHHAIGDIVPGITSPAEADTGFDPETISGLKIWLKADAIVAADGASVATWEDSSASNQDVTQGVAGLRPTYQTNELNGLPVVRFDGSDDFLGTTSFIGVMPSAGSIYVVATINSDTDYALVDVSGNGLWRYAGDGNSYMRVMRTDRPLIGSGAPTTGSHLFVVESSAATWNYTIDGVSIGTATPGYESQDFIIGSNNTSSPLNGDIAEVLIYNSVLSAPNRAAVETYLTDKWGL